jgi:hypothetical protein
LYADTPFAASDRRSCGTRRRLGSEKSEAGNSQITENSSSSHVWLVLDMNMLRSRSIMSPFREGARYLGR